VRRLVEVSERIKKRERPGAWGWGEKGEGKGKKQIGKIKIAPGKKKCELLKFIL